MLIRISAAQRKLGMSHALVEWDQVEKGGNQCSPAEAGNVTNIPSR